MHAPGIIRGTFTDSEEWCAAISDWNLEFRQIDCGPLLASIERVMCSNLVVQRVQLSRRFHQRGFAPNGVLTFGVPDQCDTINWYSKSAQKQSLMNFNRRNGFDAVSDSGFAANTLSIGSDAFQREAASLGYPMSADEVRDSADQYLVSNGDLDRIRIIVKGLLGLAAQDELAEKAVEELQNDLMHLLVRSLTDPNALTAKSSHTHRQQAVDRAVELIRTDTHTNSLGEIYEYSGVSYRTLNRAFNERFGVGPKQYIVAMKLAGVRRTLMNAQSSGRITDVASDYKRMFGELPSDTLKNRAQ
jgi:AraC family ethanolamine operon transcriptional activator